MSSYKFKTTNIKGKEYVEVNQRIIAFRTLSEYNGHSIETELLNLDSDSCVVRATIRNNEGVIVAQGMAQEDRTSSMINKTSYVENCETSAVGRALGFLGIGIETSIATADEVSMAIKKQDSLSSSSSAPSENEFFQKAIDHIKAQPKDGRQAAFDSVIKHYGSKFSEKQIESLKKFL